MRIRMLTSVKDGSGWIQPGAVRDISDEEANRLIRLRAAEPVKVPTPSEDPEIVADEDEEYSEEELIAISDSLKEIDGVNEEISYRLIEEGFVSVESIVDAEPEDLIKIKGVGKRNVGKIQESAADIVDGSDADEDEDEEESDD